MNIEEAIGVLGYQLNMKDTDVYTPINYEAIETVLNELELRNKLIVRKNVRLNEYAEDIADRDEIINKMAEYISNLDIEEDICTKNTINPELCNEEHSNCKECIKEYFYKKVEEKNNESN